jgi:hypothetical protein
MTVLDSIILVLAYAAGLLGVILVLLYTIMTLIGKILKQLGYYKMFYQTMMRMAKEGAFKKK